MKILVTGAGGFLGRYVVAELGARGHTVRAMLRPASPDPDWPREVEVFRADLTANDLRPAFADVDAVVHLAAKTFGTEAEIASAADGTERLLEAMALSQARRLVHVSSLVVYDWSRACSTLDEDTPLLKDPDVAAMGAYTIAKVRQERLVSRFSQMHGWDLTIARPGYVWGPQHAEIAGMGRHIGPLYLMFGPLGRLPLTHVANCAHALASILESPAAVGGTFNILDKGDIRVWRYVWEYARGTAQPGLPVPLPYGLSHAAIRAIHRFSTLLLGSNLTMPSLLAPRRFESQFKPLRFGHQKLEETLGWTPPASFEECVKQTYAAAPDGPAKESLSLEAMEPR